MRLLNKIQYGAIIALVYISLSCLFIGEVLGGQDPSPQNSISELKTAVISKKQGIVQDEPRPKEVITRLFEIKNVDVNEAKKSLQSLLTKDKDIASSIEIFTVQRSGKNIDYLVAKDTPQNIEQISLAMERLEKEFAPVLVNVDFTDVELSKILTTVARTSNLNIVGGAELSQKVSIHLKNVPLEKVFDILLSSSGYTYLREDEVLRIVSEEKALVTEVFELKYVSASKVEQVVAQLISKEGKSKSFSKFQDNAYSHFLIITDTKEVVERIRQLVERLDRRKRQVMIEVKFAEVTLDKSDQLGIDWVLKASLKGATGPTTFPLGKEAEALLAQPLLVTRPTGTFTLGTISYAEFSATFNARDSKTRTTLIASPSVATGDGEAAEIIIGDKVPIPLYERAKDTGIMSVSGYQDENVGVLLRVTPVINNDNTVTLKIHPEVSEITGYTGPNNERPIVSTREVTTSFTLENGKTIVLGGLMKKIITNTERRVPFLGHIPMLGRIFTYHDDEDTRKELLVFITPHILGESENVSVEEMRKGLEAPK